MGRKCYQIGLKEERLGKKDNLWVENFISLGKSKQIGQNKNMLDFFGKNIYSKSCPDYLFKTET